MNPMSCTLNINKFGAREKFQNVSMMMHWKIFRICATNEQNRVVKGHFRLELVVGKVDDVGVESSVNGINVHPPSNFPIGGVNVQVH